MLLEKRSTYLTELRKEDGASSPCLKTEVSAPSFYEHDDGLVRRRPSGGGRRVVSYLRPMFIKEDAHGRA